MSAAGKSPDQGVHLFCTQRRRLSSESLSRREESRTDLLNRHKWVVLKNLIA